NAIAKDGMEGIRHLGLAYKEITYTPHFNILEHEDSLKFLGYVRLIDPLRPTTKRTIELAEKLGIGIKILSGDSKEVVEYVGKQIGLLKDKDIVVTGEEIEKMSEMEFRKIVEEVDVFAKVTPEQKYKIISELKNNHIVGYQGDGINDAPSLKLADVAIAVNTATDVAKDSADIVLLRKDLEVIVSGIQYGRGIFVNINKYIKHTMIGNLGSLFSLGVLYLVVFDLPLLPIQLLLGNLIQDIPLITIFSDNVNEDEVKEPQKYNIHKIMFISLFLGAFSAIFDFIYFAFLGFRVTQYTETSLFLFFTFTQLIIIFSVRNKKHLWQGKRPSSLVVGSIIFFLF
ncbi:MAG TPA: HAD-IC family P-type ATPase, partial [Nitrosopumilaceae archaeon]|nr:HAD-IC family P-type ATPase [Nitrosopumilaceae archaeon]